MTTLSQSTGSWNLHKSLKAVDVAILSLSDTSFSFLTICLQAACIAITQGQIFTDTTMVAGTTPDEVNIVNVLGGKTDYTDVVEAFNTNDLVNELISNGQPLTLLAPTNSAFSALPKVEFDAIKYSNTDAYVLRYHVLIGYFKYVDLYGLNNGSTIETLAGPRIDVTGGLPGGRVQFRSQNGGISYLSHPDVVTNGQLAVQGVNSVLIPAGVTPPGPPINSNFELPPPIAAPKPPPFPSGLLTPDSPAPSPTFPLQASPSPSPPQNRPLPQNPPPSPKIILIALTPPQGINSVVVSAGSSAQLIGVAKWSNGSNILVLCLLAWVGLVAIEA